MWSASAIRSPFLWIAAPTYFSSTPRSISTVSIDTLGTSTLSASGAPLRS
jgi:hypothetical protein